MKKPNVSVIMPAHNAAAYIGQAIRSILDQSFSAWELLIIDDASTDDTSRLVKTYQKKDDRIRLFSVSKNLGPSAARNLGIKHARGAYLAILDSDDLAHPLRLEKEYLYLQSHKDATLVAGSYDYIDESGRVLWKKQFPKEKVLTLEEAQQDCQILHSSVMFRKDAKLLYDVRLRQAEDLDIYLQILNRGKKIVILPDLFAHYRIHIDALSSKKRSEQLILGKHVLARYFSPSSLLARGPLSIQEKEPKNVQFIKRKLSILYESDLPKSEYRSQFRVGVKEEGLLAFRRELIYYIASYFPDSFKTKVKFIFRIR